MAGACNGCIGDQGAERIVLPEMRWQLREGSFEVSLLLVSLMRAS